MRSSSRAALWFSLLAALLLLGPLPPAVRSAQLQVTSAADSGVGTLRQALLDAGPGDTITFSLSVFPPGSPATIYLRSVLPTLNKDNVTIDASDVGVILDGSRTPAGTNGLIVEGSNCMVRGLTIQEFSSNGIFVASGAVSNTIGGDRGAGSGPNGQGNRIVANDGSGVEIRGDGNRVQGNYVGIDASGWWAVSNAYNGVALWQGANDNVIGGATSSQRNVISGNGQNGVWIGGSGSDRNRIVGNYVGTRADGLGPVANHLSGISIQSGARDNRIGGTGAGEGNLISGNSDNGVHIADPGSTGNQVLGNLIGHDRNGTGVIGQGLDGVVIQAGASSNAIGSSAPGGRNVIAGSALDGVRIAGSDTMSNTVQGNYVSTDVSGSAALPNGMHGVELTAGAHDNRVGGNRLAGEGNLLSGDGNHGVVISEGAHHNTVSGNLIGPDATGTHSLGRHPFGGIDISEGAHHNVIGGLFPGEGNLISGNQTDGIALFKFAGADVTDNELLGNVIGLALDGHTALPNGGFGILNTAGVWRTRIYSNTIAYNQSFGVLVATCSGNTISQNSIYSNTLAGIRMEGTCLPAPAITDMLLGPTDVVTGTAAPDARVEVYSDDEDEGRVYEGFTTADGLGQFTLSKAGGFAGPNLTATSTDANGNTSEFSPPAHLLWTVLLYLNGDNDLEEAMFDALDYLAAAGPSPRANVLALVDGYKPGPRSGTILYDVTRGVTTSLSAPWVASGELDMGDGQTLVDFVRWGRAYYPARHTMLAIVDHGGGWAPTSTGAPISGTLAHRRDWLAGNSGLSWDFSSSYDYLDSVEIRQAMAAITDDGARPLDVVFYDVCLMGMLEVAYQVHDYASFFVSSQNVGWAPAGPQNRYVRAIHGIGPATTPRQMAQLLVQAYASGVPAEAHPFTISAVDLTSVLTLTQAVDRLATTISQTLTGPAQAAVLEQAYQAAQKLDYDSDMRIEPAAEGFVDLYDLARLAAQQFTDSAVIVAAQQVIAGLSSAVVAEAHRSGVPWVAPDQVWDLDNVHGLSLFLPLGEDLELPIAITETSPITPGLTITRPLRLRDMYTSSQLRFVSDTAWGALIDTYYRVISSPVPTETTQGPVDGLQPPDLTPPRTVVAISGTLAVGQPISVAWAATDAQSGAQAATLWHRPPGGLWTSVLTQTGSSGAFLFSPAEGCQHRLAVQAVDRAGNLEPVENGSNVAIVEVYPCRRYLPVVMRRYAVPR